MKKQIQSVIAGAAIVAAMGTIGLGVVGSAQAQSVKSGAVNALNTSATTVNGVLQTLGMRGGPKGPDKNIAAIAAVLKLTEAELKAQVHSGKTLAQIATAQGVSVRSVVNMLVADMKAHIAQEVASGEITQAQANTMLADVSTKVTEMVNTVRPARGEDMRGSGHGPRGHHKNDSHDNDGEHPNA